MLPQSYEITYFLEVAKTLNLSRAAERLGVSQPALTISLKKLEANLGVDLFYRSKSGMQLTKHGESFLVKAHALHELWESCQEQSRLDKNEIQGHFRLGVHVSVALFTLRHFLPKFMALHPDFHLSLTHDLSRKITEQVISHKLDVGIVVNPVRHPDLVIKDLYTDEVSFWESPSNKNNEVLIADDQLIQSQTLMKKNNFNRMITSSSLEVVLSLTESGAGVGILPGRVAALSHNKLEKSKNNPKTYLDKMCLIYRPESKKLLAMEALIRTIEDNLKNK